MKEIKVTLDHHIYVKIPNRLLTDMVAMNEKEYEKNWKQIHKIIQNELKRKWKKLIKECYYVEDVK